MLLHHSSTLIVPTSPSFFTSSSTPIRFSFRPLSRRRRTSAASGTGDDTHPLPNSAIQRIAEKLRSLGYIEDEEEDEEDPPIETNSTPSPGEIFVPLPTHLPKYRVGHTLDPSWSTAEAGGKKRRESAPSLAELKLPAEELRRLRTVGIALKKKIKVGKDGISEGIVNGIHERWRRSEVVRVKCDDVCSLNMKRTHDLLERKTGGLVVWRSGSNIILYRGKDYKYPYFLTNNNTSSNRVAKVSCTNDGEQTGKFNYSSGDDISSSANSNSSGRLSHPPLIRGVGSPNKVRFQMPGEAQLAEEADRLLEGLGPRFTDWWGYDPLPVDGDLLPAVVPVYRRPFRLLPYGVSPKLTNDEITILKRLGRPLPCHFVLGRNSKHQGLAAAIVKLWEKCEIVKIAVKRGVENTNSELMAEELKRLTGGVLLSRDREIIVLYRGKDFLPAAVSSAIEERRKSRIDGAMTEIDIRSSVTPPEEHQDSTVPYFSKDENSSEDNQTLKFEYRQQQQMLTEEDIGRTSSKLSMTLAKKGRAEELLANLEKEEAAGKSDTEKEGITEEERYMLRKVGLRMGPFLLLGRRGVFDGTIENMHLHWKYRELVKILIGKKSTEEVHRIAQILEAESGGILVAVEQVSKGYAIIVYRGKNYERPACLRPQTLLSKREAMKRSLEEQRRQSLKLHVLKLSQTVDDLKLQLAKAKDMDDTQLAEDLELGQVQEHEIQNTAQESESGMSDVISVTSSDPHPSELQVQEPETEDIKLTECETSNHTVTGTNSQSCEEENSPVAASNSLGSENQTDDSRTSLALPQQGSEISSGDEDDKVEKLDMIGQEPLPEIVRTRFTVSSEMQLEDLQCETNLLAMDNANPQVSGSENATPRVVPTDSEPGPVERTVADVSRRTRRSLHLSNRERLVLRKQALKMEKRPLFSIGKSNIVTGVAKVLKLHFERHPLAIVNVKGRAKGTSVRELVFKLEEATAAVFVSQEPNKIILYRGWGADEEPAQTPGRVSREGRSITAGVTGANQPVVSPELIDAIRLECGLQRDS